jgi:hypothetical protein
VLAICGIGTASNQIVLGGASDSYTGLQAWYNSLRYVYTAGGAEHDEFFVSATPGGVQAAPRGSLAYLDDGAVGGLFIKMAATDNSGWDQAAVLLTAQTFSIGAKTFNSSIMKTQNPGKTFSYTWVASAIAANRNINIPLLTADDTLAVLAEAQTFITGGKTFNSSILKVRNPGDTFSYTFVAAAIAANRNLNIPLLTGDDTLMVLGLNQTVTGILTLTTPVIGAATGTSLAVSGAVTSSGTAGIGYAAGAGGTIAQATSKATGVAMNKICGQITMNAAALAAATSVQFTFTNTLILAGDVIIVNFQSVNSANSYTVTVDAVAVGSCKISLRNYTAGSLSEAIVLNFAVIKSVTA